MNGPNEPEDISMLKKQKSAPQAEPKEKVEVVEIEESKDQ